MKPPYVIGHDLSTYEDIHGAPNGTCAKLKYNDSVTLLVKTASGWRNDELDCHISSTKLARILKNSRKYEHLQIVEHQAPKTQEEPFEVGDSPMTREDFRNLPVGTVLYAYDSSSAEIQGLYRVEENGQMLFTSRWGYDERVDSLDIMLYETNVDGTAIIIFSLPKGKE